MKVENKFGTTVMARDLTTNALLPLDAKQFKGNIVVGARIDYKDGKYFCTGNGPNNDCPGGVCPVN